MKKIIFLGVATLLAAGMSSSFAATTTVPSTANLTVSGVITGSTCTVSFPTNATVPEISQAIYESATANAQLGSDVNVGNIQLLGCGGKTVSLTAKGDSPVVGEPSKGYFTYKNTAAGSENPLYYTLATSDKLDSGNFLLDGSAAHSLAVDASDSSHNVPVILKTMKNGSTLSDIDKYVGDFSATVTYTADYK